MITLDTFSVPAPIPTAFRRFTWVAVLLLGLGSYVTVLAVIRHTGVSNLIPALLLLGSAVVPLTVLVFAASGGRRILAPASMVVLTVVAGGFIGTVSAAVLEYDAMHRLTILPMIFVGLIEESTKLVVPLVLLLILRRPSPQAGVVVGIASGLGFAALETMGYGFSAFMREGSLSALDRTLIVRAITSPALHVAWTGLTVAALWRIPGATRRARATMIAIGAFVTAVLMHAAWDGVDQIAVKLVLVVVGVTMLMIMITRAHAAPPAPCAGRRSRAPQAPPLSTPAGSKSARPAQDAKDRRPA